MTPERIARLPLRPCVGVVLIAPDRRVFAGRRVDNPADAWQMPQGGIDPGETPAEAALRELEEETGVGARLVAPLREGAGWLDYALPPELVPRFWVWPRKRPPQSRGTSSGGRA